MSEELEQREDARAARLLAQLPEPSPAVIARVRGRLNKPAPVATNWRLAGLGLTALAAASLLAFTSWPTAEAPAPAVAVAATLDADGTWATDTQVPGVALSYEGTGTMSGDPGAPKIQWEVGTINIEVVPNRDIKLSVHTEQAVVRVVGTGFTVTKDALGTAVSVRHGKVEVDCTGELTRVLEAGDSLTCMPTTAAGMAARASILVTRGASHAEVLATVDRALALPDATGSVSDELAARRFTTLLAMGRTQEALADARTFAMERPNANLRPQILAAAAELAAGLGGCATAAPWLADVSPESCK